MLLNPLLKALNGVIQEQINPLNAELNPICHLLALLEAHHFLHISRIRVKTNKFIHATDMGKPAFTPRIIWNVAFADRQTNKNSQNKGTEIKMW
jgi:hypothetical protein